MDDLGPTVELEFQVVHERENRRTKLRHLVHIFNPDHIGPREGADNHQQPFSSILSGTLVSGGDPSCVVLPEPLTKPSSACSGTDLSWMFVTPIPRPGCS
jgi:hypothetical protein